MNIADIIEWRARKYGDKTAIRHKRRNLSFAEVNDRAGRFVAALHAMGMRRGDRVAILSETCDAYAEIMLSVAAGGLVLVPLNSRFIPAELAFTVNDSGAATLIVGTEYLHVLAEMRSHLHTVQNVIVLGPPSDGMQGYEALIAAYPPALLAHDVADTELGYIIYTSGTTARPKGVMRSHKSIIATATATAYHHGLRHDDVCYLPNPPFHISFVWPLVAYYCMGCTTVIERWHAPDALRTISRERVSFGVFVPFYIRSLLDSPDIESYDLSSLRRLSMGSAPMDEPLARRAITAFGNIFNYNYGMTEYGSPIAMIRGESIDLSTDRGRELLSSVGRGVFNADVRVVDSDGQDVAPGATGEVIVRGDALMSGYWNMPDETARTIRDSYFHTGDIARVDADGNLFIVDRAKDMIITGGENVFCPEVESALMMHPAVKEAAVIGVPDDTWGEAVKGMIICHPGKSVPREELRAFCRIHLAGYKIPKSFEFMEEFPRTPLGKISKKELRAPFWADRSRNVN